MSSAEERSSLRQSFKSARAAVDDPERRAEIIAQYLAPMITALDRVAAYQAMPGEVSLEPLFQTRTDQVWGLPRTGANHTMTFHAWSRGEELEKGEFGIAVPSASAAIIDCSIILIPLVAFDDHGTRLGMGGGFYDRYLSQLPIGTPKIGVAFDCQRSGTPLPKEVWDVTLSKVVTESGVLEFAD